VILYLDTSALLKKYFKEDGSTDLIALWKGSKAIVTSSVTYAESTASIYRKKREVGDIDSGIFKSIFDRFQKDWKSFIRVDVNDDLNEAIDKMVATHPLRGFDAIHLASALVVHETVAEEFLFAGYDKKLSKVAREEGLITHPENID